MDGHLSRRRLLGGGLATLAALGLVGCGSDDSPGTTGTTTDGTDTGPWRWTDGIGQTVELPSRPTRIAAYGDQAVALISFGITPVALFHYVDPADDPTFEGVDLSGIEVVGTAYGELDLERLLGEVAPDLIVTTSYPGEDVDSMYGFKDKTQLETIREVCPVIGVLQEGTAEDVITANEALVAALGVDVTTGTISDDRDAWRAAGEELTKAASGGLTVTAAYADKTGLWLAKAADDPALSYYAQLGVEFTEIGGADYYWETVSWENADAYPSDVVLYSLRASYTPDQLMAEPVFASLPAAQADQLHPWKFKSMDYRSQASYMTELAGWLSSDTRVL